MPPLPPIGRVNPEVGSACILLPASHRRTRRSHQVDQDTYLPFSSSSSLLESRRERERRMRRRNRSSCSEEIGCPNERKKRSSSLSSSSFPRYTPCPSASFSRSLSSSSSFLSLSPRRRRRKEEEEDRECCHPGVPLPMPFWGKYDVYPPLHASSIDRIRPFCQLDFHDSFPLYCDLPFEKKKTKTMIRRRNRRDDDFLLDPYPPSVRYHYPSSFSSPSLSEAAFSSPLLDRDGGRRRRARGLGGGSSLPESGVSFLCKHHRGRHLHLIDLFSPSLSKDGDDSSSSLIRHQYDEKEANEIHKRSRGCLGVHTPLCHEGHAALRRVDRNEESRPLLSELDEFPQQTRNPASLWWSHVDQKDLAAKREESEREEKVHRNTIDERDWMFKGRRGSTRSSETLMNDRKLYSSDRSRLY